MITAEVRLNAAGIESIVEEPSKIVCESDMMNTITKMPSRGELVGSRKMRRYDALSSSFSAPHESWKIQDRLRSRS